MNPCISYKVNPDQLNAGIPVDQLEKRNVRVITNASENLFTKGIAGLSRHQQYVDKSRAAPATHPILRLQSEDYAAATHGKAIAVPAHFCHLIGRDICLINEYSNSHKVLQLHKIISGKGYFL